MREATPWQARGLRELFLVPKIDCYFAFGNDAVTISRSLGVRTGPRVTLEKWRTPIEGDARTHRTPKALRAKRRQPFPYLRVLASGFGVIFC